MKLNKVGATTALLAAAVGLVGCSSDQNQGKPSGKEASVGFHLLADQGVVITSANYDLNTQAGADVVDGALPVPNDDSEISLGVQNLGAGDYSLAFSATGMVQGQAVPCSSAPTLFHLNAAQQLSLPTITLKCTLTKQTDTSSGIDASVVVSVETITVGSVIETFTYGPRTVKGHLTAGVCAYPPVALKVATTATSGVAYSWTASPDGTFAGSNGTGTYQCVSGGVKTLTLTGVKGATTSTKSVTVNCDDSICLSGVVCGNGLIETGEQCDETSARCTNCHITPVCGDGTTDAPEQCDAVGLPTASCDINCHSIAPISCGDGIKNGSEECDNGTANSDTAPNACRTTCKLPKCGDGVADTGEACDSGTANSDTNPNACRTTCAVAKCGDGVVDTGEQCDATMLPTSSCDSSCTTITAPPPAKHVACQACIATSADADPQNLYCNPDAKCVTAENCFIDKGCFSPLPALCYCGTTNVNACADVAFVPTGLCVAEIKAGEGALSSNQAYLTGLFDFANPVGVASQILLDVPSSSSQCTSLCL